MKKKCFTFSLLLFYSVFLFAQDKQEDLYTLVKVSKDYNGEQVSGYSVALDMGAKFTSSYIKERLSIYGKLSDVKDLAVIRNVVIGELDGITISTSTEKASKNQSVLWLSFVQYEDFQDSLTKEKLKEFTLDLLRKDTDVQLADNKKTYEKNLSEAISLNKKLANTKKAKAKKAKGVVATSKQIGKLTSQLGKAQRLKENYLNERNNLEVDSEARQKMDKKYEKTASKVISLQKKLTSQEKKQLNFTQGIRKDEDTIKVLTGKLEKNEAEKKQLEKDLSELKAKQALLYPL